MYNLKKFQTEAEYIEYGLSNDFIEPNVSLIVELGGGMKFQEDMPLHVTGITLNKNALEINTEQTETLVATVLPQNAYDKSFTWSSSNQSVATVNNNGLVTPVNAGQTNITVTTTDGSYTAQCQTVVKKPSYIEIETGEAFVGEDAVIMCKIDEDATGYVNVNVGGSNYSQEISYGEATFYISDLSAGIHTITATYPGDNTYSGCTYYSEIEVEKVQNELELIINDIDYGDDAIIECRLGGKDTTGYVEIYVNNILKETVPVFDRFAVSSISGLTVGTYSINANYIGDEKYLPCSGAGTFEVYQFETGLFAEVESSYHSGNSIIITIVFYALNPSNNLSATINNVSYPINDFKVVITEGLDVGNYTFVVSYPGDVNNTSASYTRNFTVI